MSALRRYNSSEARSMLEDIPLDNGMTDEESDSSEDEAEDMDDFLPVGTFVQINHDDDPGDEGATVTDDRPGPSGATGARRQSPDQISWRKTDATERHYTFRGSEGPVASQFDKFDKPVDVFITFMDSSVEGILEHTNLYKTQQERYHIAAVTKPELLGFVGINILMGYHRLPSWRHYWCPDPDLGVPLVSETMSRNRFGQILSNLHVNDNTAMPQNNTDKLYKLRPLIDTINDTYVKLYDVSRVLSVDESMILFKGRCSIKQYNPMKPIKRGYKLWTLADWDGYVSKFEVYQGKNGVRQGELGLGEDVVVRLTEGLKGKWHEVYFDNYFTSLPLLQILLDNEVKGCGTIRSNRKGLPQFTEDKKLSRGEFDCRISKDGGLMVSKWMDNKGVHVASNFHGTEIVSVNRTQKDGSALEVPCPKSCADYNKNMGCVDKADMLCALYGINRRSKKWWHRIFWGIIDRTIVNAFVAHKKLTGEKYSLLQFRRSLARSLLAMAHPPKVGRPMSTPKPSPVPKKRKTKNYSVPSCVREVNLGAHFVAFVNKRARCEVCTSKGIESRPESQCSCCKVHLCCNKNKNCFNEYHNIE